MKITVIGDTHGRNNWETIVDREKDSDYIIFLGDYMDSFDISLEKTKKNFYNILDYKNKNNNVVLLLGNHDWHYIMNGEQYSGFNYKTFRWANLALRELLNDGTIEICKVIDNIIFSHAGVTKTWLKMWILTNNVQDITWKNISAKSLNFTYGSGYSIYGDCVESSPIWVRPDSLKSDLVEGYIQVVGHTRIEQIQNIDSQIWLCDNISDGGQYLVIEKNNDDIIFKIKETVDK